MLACGCVRPLRDEGTHWAGTKPTSGFQAIVAMGLACKSVRLYGFAGTTSLDGHAMAADHGIAQEHVLLDQLRAHTLDMPASLQEFWPTANVTVVC